MRLAALAIVTLSACGSSTPNVGSDGPPLGMASAGEIEPPARLCDTVKPLPPSGPVASWAEGLRSIGVDVPAGEEGNDAGCALDAFQCRAMHVSIFTTAEYGMQHVGFDDGQGNNTLVKDGFGETDDGTCGVTEAARFDTIFGGPTAVAMRTFSDCQSAMDYRDWLLFDTQGKGAFGLVHCQGPSDLSVDDAGKVTFTCLGKTFTFTSDEFMVCYAG